MNQHNVMEQNTPTSHIFNMVTVRLALSGAIIGIALMGLIHQFPYDDAVGGIVGGVLVLIARAREFF